jgi:AcrR family transcriptional regulator
LEEIVETGLRMADDDGLATLSIRGLAASLEVGPMTIYSYVRSKDELLDAIAMSVLGALKDDEPIGETWQQRLESAMRSLYALLRAHPGVAEHVSSGTGPIQGLDPFRERLLSILEDAGLPDDEAVQAVSALSSYVLGSARVQRRVHHTSVLAEADRLRDLHPGRFPHLARTADIYAEHISEAAFSLGLRALIRGLSMEPSTGGGRDDKAA